MPPHNKLVFIIKTPASENLSHSDGLERSKIFSHVQQGPHLQKPAQLEGDDLRLHVQHDITRSLSDRAAARDHESTQLYVGSSEISSCTAAIPCDASSRRRHLGLCLSPKPTLSTLDCASADLIYDAGGIMSPYMKTLLEFFDTPLIYRIHHASKAVTSSRQDTISLALQNPALLAALLCATSSAMYIESEEPEHLLSSIRFRGQTISHLKRQIHRSSGPEALLPTLYAISILLWAECIQGNVNEMQAHLSGLKTLLDCLEGKLPASSAAVGMIYACSHLCAAVTQTRPQLSLPTFRNTTFSASTLTAVHTTSLPAISRMSTTFFSEPTTNLISPPLLTIVSHQRLYIAFNTLCTLNHLEPTDHDLRVSANLQLLVEHQLLLMAFDTPLTPVQDAVRLALFVFAQSICSVVKSRSAFSQSIAGQLHKQLRIAEPMLREEEGGKELLIWLCFILAYVAGESREGEWAVGMMIGLIEQSRLRTGDEPRGLLEGFYYVEGWFEETLGRVWDGMNVRKTG